MIIKELRFSRILKVSHGILISGDNTATLLSSSVFIFQTFGFLAEESGMSVILADSK